MKSNNPIENHNEKSLEEYLRDESRFPYLKLGYHPLLAPEGCHFLKLHVQVDRRMEGQGIIHPQGRLGNRNVAGDLYIIGLGAGEGRVEFSSLYHDVPKSDKYDFFTLALFILDEFRGTIQPKFIEGENVNVRTLRDLSLRVSNKNGTKIAYSLNYELTNDLI